MSETFNVMGPPELVDVVLQLPGVRVTDTWSKRDASIKDVNVYVPYDVCDRFVEACEDQNLTCKLV